MIMKKHTRRIPSPAAKATAAVNKNPATQTTTATALTNDESSAAGPVLAELTERLIVLPMPEIGGEQDASGSSLKDFESVAISFSSPFQHGIKHMSVDCAEAGWYSDKAEALRLQFHLILLDPQGAVEGLIVRTKGAEHRIPFEFLASPMLGQANPDFPWALSARLAIDTKIENVKLDIGENSLLAKINQEWKDVAKICRAC